MLTRFRCCPSDEWEDMEAEDMEESADEQITSDAAEMQEENVTLSLDL